MNMIILRKLCVMVLMIAGSLNAVAYTREEIVDKLNYIAPGLAQKLSDEDIVFLISKEDRDADIYMLRWGYLVTKDRTAIAADLLENYQKYKQNHKYTFDEMNSLLFGFSPKVKEYISDPAEDPEFSATLDLFIPLFLSLDLKPIWWEASMKKETWKKTRTMKIANHPLLVQALSLKYDSKNPQAGVQAVKTAMDGIIREMKSKDLEILKPSKELKKEGDFYSLRIPYFATFRFNKGRLIPCKMEGLVPGRLTFKFPNYRNGGEMTASADPVSFLGNGKFSYNCLGLCVEGRKWRVNVIPDSIAMKNYFMQRLAKSKKHLQEAIDGDHPSIGIFLALRGFKWRNAPDTYNGPELTSDDMLTNARFDIIFDDGEVQQAHLVEGKYGTVLTFPYMEELIAENTKKIQDENAQKRAAAKKKLDALVAKCKASNYVKMSADDLEILEKKGYITVDGYDAHVYGTGAYLTIKNKWGVSKRLRFDGNGYVVGQR